MKEMIDTSFWKGKRVFVTGHTGFKGGWLCLWLEMMGSEVMGFSLSPVTKINLFDEANVAEGIRSITGDVRDKDSLFNAVSQFKPEIVIHMAAQPLVRRSYEYPRETFETNVMGTVNVLEAVKKIEGVKVVINVTTDKCYENNEWIWGYRETEPLGGHDPYSSSKACSELVTSAYRRSFFYDSPVAIATARAGNVIGGGDWSDDRLVPDILGSFELDRSAYIRNPHAIRPWQHVLEPLSGYLMLAEKLFNYGDRYEGAWNFGPGDSDVKSVEWIVRKIADEWGLGSSWSKDSSEQPHEASSLKLDISKAKTVLGWSPLWSLDQSIKNIVHWHKSWLNNSSARQLCLEQINQYMTIEKEQHG